MLPKVTQQMIQAIRREMVVQPENAFFEEISHNLEKSDPILAKFIVLLWMENGGSPKLRRGLLGLYHLLSSQYDAEKLNEWFQK